MKNYNYKRIDKQEIKKILSKVNIHNAKEVAKVHKELQEKFGCDKLTVSEINKIVNITKKKDWIPEFGLRL